MEMTSAGELHRAMFEAIGKRDFDGLRKLFANDATHTSGDGVEKQGPEPVVEEVKAFTTAFPDLEITPRQQLEPSEGLSVIEYTFSGTHHGELEGISPTGRAICVVACSVLEAKGGVITREADYYDTMALMTQLGASR
jgi:steroid delta-isomerase-like uncharacterized protein